MAVLKIKSFMIAAMQRDRKRILEFLQYKGIAEIKDTDMENEIFFKADTHDDYVLYQKNSEKAAKAVNLLDEAYHRRKPALAFLHGRNTISVHEMESVAVEASEIMRFVDRVIYLRGEIDSAKASVSQCEVNEAAIKSWEELPVPETFTGTAHTTAYIGSLPGVYSAEEVLKLIGGDTSRLYIEIVYAAQEQTNLFIIAPRALELNKRLQYIGFTRPAAPDQNKPPGERKRYLEHRRTELLTSISEMANELEALAGSIQRFELVEDYYAMRSEKYRAINQLAHSKHTFFMEGFILERDASELKSELEKRFKCTFDVSEADEAEVPVYLESPIYAQALSSVLESYSMPGPGEFDPLPVMSLFYYLLFGLMFSDAGYGLIMAAVCAFCLHKYRNMEENWKRNLRMFLMCGVATMFWGIVFSSYFGDVLNVVSRVFFGREIGIPPLWFAPLEKPMLLLILCLGLGIVHLSAGFLMKARYHFARKQPLDAFYDAILPLILIYPLVIIFMGTDMFGEMAGFRLNLSEKANNGLLWIAVITMLGIAATAGRENKGVIRIITGLYTLYNTLAGWLADTLSYSRLLALGLATGVIASVMNQLGSMAGNGILGFILFVFVFIVGQTLNFGINALGAYVHSNRLEYVEFFGKFYEGGGHKFHPFGVHTRHIKIKKEVFDNG